MVIEYQTNIEYYFCDKEFTSEIILKRLTLDLYLKDILFMNEKFNINELKSICSNKIKSDELSNIYKMFVIRDENFQTLLKIIKNNHYENCFELFEYIHYISTFKGRIYNFLYIGKNLKKINENSDLKIFNNIYVFLKDYLLFLNSNNELELNKVDISKFHLTFKSILFVMLSSVINIKSDINNVYDKFNEMLNLYLEMTNKIDKPNLLKIKQYILSIKFNLYEILFYSKDNVNITLIPDLNLKQTHVKFDDLNINKLDNIIYIFNDIKKYISNNFTNIEKEKAKIDFYNYFIKTFVNCVNLCVLYSKKTIELDVKRAFIYFFKENLNDIYKYYQFNLFNDNFDLFNKNYLAIDSDFYNFILKNIKQIKIKNNVYISKNLNNNSHIEIIISRNYLKDINICFYNDILNLIEDKKNDFKHSFIREILNTILCYNDGFNNELSEEYLKLLKYLKDKEKDIYQMILFEFLNNDYISLIKKEHYKIHSYSQINLILNEMLKNKDYLIKNHLKFDYLLDYFFENNTILKKSNKYFIENSFLFHKYLKNDFNLISTYNNLILLNFKNFGVKFLFHEKYNFINPEFNSIEFYNLSLNVDINYYYVNKYYANDDLINNLYHVNLDYNTKDMDFIKKINHDYTFMHEFKFCLIYFNFNNLKGIYERKELQKMILNLLNKINIDFNEVEECFNDIINMMLLKKSSSKVVNKIINDKNSFQDLFKRVNTKTKINV